MRDSRSPSPCRRGLAPRLPCPKVTVDLLKHAREEALRQRREALRRRRNRRRRVRRVLALAALVAASVGAGFQVLTVLADTERRRPPSTFAGSRGQSGTDRPATGETVADGSRTRGDARERAGRNDRRRVVVWRTSTALGSPDAGRLVKGVLLPGEGAHFVTWDPERKRSPNRAWRRYATDRTVRKLLAVVNASAVAHPGAPRAVVGDLSRRTGGDFGRRFGKINHVSHQNGLDVDVYYPRRDQRERAPRTPAQVDKALSQDLVERFVAAGASRIFVGRRLALTGPPTIVQPWPNHDDHLHVRFGDRAARGAIRQP